MTKMAMENHISLEKWGGQKEEKQINGWSGEPETQPRLGGTLPFHVDKGDSIW